MAFPVAANAGIQRRHSRRSDTLNPPSVDEEVSLLQEAALFCFVMTCCIEAAGSGKQRHGRPVIYRGFARVGDWRTGVLRGLGGGGRSKSENDRGLPWSCPERSAGVP